MSQTTDLHDEPSVSRTLTPPAASAPVRIWGKIKLVVTRSIFWAYERGTWQYDLIVIAILAFIFLSPRSWFNDRPTLQMTNLRNQQGIVEMGRANKEVRYLLDSRLVDASEQKPEEAIPEILKQHLSKPFTVRSIDAVRDRQKVVLGYTVVVVEE